MCPYMWFSMLGFYGLPQAMYPNLLSLDYTDFCDGVWADEKKEGEA